MRPAEKRFKSLTAEDGLGNSLIFKMFCKRHQPDNISLNQPRPFSGFPSGRCRVKRHIATTFPIPLYADLPQITSCPVHFAKKMRPMREKALDL